MVDQPSTGLHWVADEIEATLEEVSAALAAFLHSPGDRRHLQFCQAHLHQVGGALALAESQGGALLVAAIGDVVAALLRGEFAGNDEAGEALAAATATLPGYLRRSLAAGRERPAALIGVLNDLRALLRQPLASEGGLFAADLTVFDDRLSLLPPARDRAELAALCRKLRQIYQHALLALLKGEQPGRQLDVLVKVGQRVRELFPGSRRELLWEVVGRMLDNLGPLAHIGSARRQLLWQLDRDLRACGELNDASLEQPPIPRELFKNVLYYAVADGNAVSGDRAGAGDHGEAWPRVADFGLSPDALDGQAGDPWSAPDTTVRAALGRELIEELGALRRLGEERIAAGDGPAEAASRLAGPAQRLRDTLTAAGLARSVAAMERAAQALNPAAEPPAPGMDPWAAWAEAIAVLDCLLQGWVATGVESEDPQALRAAVVAEARNLAIAAIRDLLDEIKDALIGHASTSADPVRLAGATGSARLVQQALWVLEQESLSEVLASCANYLAELEGHSGAVHWERLDRFADCLSAAEHYLELLVRGENASCVRALAQAQQRAARLREALPPTERMEPGARTAAGAGAVVPLETGEVLAGAAATPTPGPAPVRPSVDLADEEIRGIFIEEAREILAILAPMDLGDTAPTALKELRRGFHTLKGSGRMVGAATIGELCWMVENLLNRILEGELPWSAAVGELVARALTRLPALVEEFAAGATGATLDAADAALCAVARALAEGPSAAAAAEAAPGTSVVVQAEPTATAPAGIGTGGIEAPEAGWPVALHDEALAQLEVLERFLGRAGQAVGAPPMEVLVRAVHTLVGCCERSDHQELSRALRALEDVLTIHAERGLAPGRELLDTIARLAVASGVLTGGSASPSTELAGLQTRLDGIRTGLVSGRSRERLLAAMAGGLGELLAATEWLEQLTDGEFPAARLAPLIVEFGELAAGADAAQLPQLVRVAGLLRAGGQQWLAGARPGDPDGFRQGINQLLAMLDAVAVALPPPELPAGLAARLEAMAAAPLEPDAAPEQLAGAAQTSAPEVTRGAGADEDLDDELVTIFLEEAADLCDQLERAISGRQLESLKRCLHTLKGSARMAGCLALGELCHQLETQVLETESTVSPEALFAGCLIWYDRIEQERERIARRATAPAMADQSATLESPDRQRQPAAVAPSAQPEPSEMPVAVVPPLLPAAAAPSRVPLVRGPSTPPPWRQRVIRPGEARPGKASGDEFRETVKIAAPILDSLINLADETSVSRSRVEQQLQQFHFQIEEMETTVERFHDQVRQLGMETEAQILFRREQLTIAGTEEQFDPLELDRYSTLQHLSRALEESASDLRDLKETLLDKVRETEALLMQQARVNRDLQENLSLTRMVPFSRVVPRLRRIVRQTSSELGKPVELTLNNVEGELDRSVLERVVPPLEHLIRNAIDHGIEVPEERERSGKPGTGQVSITFAREAGDVVIKVADDGRGLDLEAIRRKALGLGLLGADAPVDERDLAQLIFHPGFSTARDVSQISGRGIGMDVVDSELRQLGGSVTPLSHRGLGVEFTLRLPFTISVNRALLMKAGRERYGALVNSVAGVVRLDDGQLEQLAHSPDAGFEYRGERYRVCRLETLVGSVEPPAVQVPGKAALVLTKDTRDPVAVLVDALDPSQEVVVKSLGPQFAKVRGLSGVTALGDGQVVPILDLDALVDHALPFLSRVDVPAQRLVTGLDPVEEMATILVVDDSVTMRKATARLLERQGYKVITARDGVEAMQFLLEITPDLMLLDIEMPRMDGFEVARQVRASARLARLPIIMITSRSGDKHRGKAMALGVDHYLGKPYQEDNLLAVVAASLPAAGVPQREGWLGS